MQQLYDEGLTAVKWNGLHAVAVRLERDQALRAQIAGAVWEAGSERRLPPVSVMQLYRQRNLQAEKLQALHHIALGCLAFEVAGKAYAADLSSQTVKERCREARIAGAVIAPFVAAAKMITAAGQLKEIGLSAVGRQMRSAAELKLSDGIWGFKSRCLRAFWTASQEVFPDAHTVMTVVAMQTRPDPASLQPIGERIWTAQYN